MYLINLFHGDIRSHVMYENQIEIIAFVMCYPQLIILWQNASDPLQQHNTSWKVKKAHLKHKSIVLKFNYPIMLTFIHQDFWRFFNSTVYQLDIVG